MKDSKENYKRIIEAIRREMPDFRIEGKYEPMKHQYVSAIFMAEHRRCFNLKDRLHDPGLLLIKENRPE